MASDIRRRQLTVAAIVATLVLAFGGGYLLARSGNDDTQASGGPLTTVSPSPTPSSTTPTATASSSASPTTSPEPHNTIPDGRHFVYAKKVVHDGGDQALTFDLALFLTDQAADDAATAHGDESPPPNGYYIVNDNPLLRTVPISPTVSIRYFPSSGPACCKHEPGTLDGFAAAVNGTAMTDYPDMNFSPWWINMQDGVIVGISQQYLP
jgi:hypothetical protein